GEANFGTLQLRETDPSQVAAMHTPPPAYAEARRRNPLIRPTPQNALGRVIATKDVVHVADYAQEPAYKERDPAAVSIVELAGARTLVLVPLLKDGEVVGNLLLYRQEVRPFTDKQISLLRNFAAQAVIAIENTRLLSELRQRTTDLGEALEQQTATAEVLQVISSSPGELQPVFDAMLANATRLCEASYGTLWLCEGDFLRSGAQLGWSSDFIERYKTAFRPSPNMPALQAIKARQTIQIADLRSTQGYRSGDAVVVEGADLAGIRTMLAVPMFNEENPV